MSIFHMYTGDDGQSHIEEPALSAQPSQETPQADKGDFLSRTSGWNHYGLA